MITSLGLFDLPPGVVGKFYNYSLAGVVPAMDIPAAGGAGGGFIDGLTIDPVASFIVRGTPDFAGDFQQEVEWRAGSLLYSATFRISVFSAAIPRTNPTSARLYDLWLANGKPDRIGYAATNGSVDAGLRFAAGSSMSCAGGALGLHEVGGRLYGRWCGVEGVPYVAAGTTGGQFVPEQRIDFHSNPAAVQTNPFGAPATLVIWGSIGAQANYPAGRWARQQNGTWPYYEWSGTVPAGFVTSVGGATGNTVTGYWVLPASTTPIVTVPASDLSALAGKVVEVSLAVRGVPWLTAGVWSRSGEWVRRKSWPDTNMMIRHEAGPGSARAVAVFKSSSVSTARALKNSEFGQAEFSAQDWVMKNPPTATDLDLTDAMIAVDASLWVLWKSTLPTVPDDGGLLPPDGGTGGGTIGSSCCGCP